MTVSFIDPLARAWTRMRLVLLAPFQLETWLVVGFTAWIADIQDLTGQTWNSEGIKWTGNEAGDVIHGLVAITLVAGVALVGIVIAVILLWVSSRAKFVYLDNVVARRAKLVEPWSEFGRLGDSLFLWRLVFHVLFLVLVVGIALPFLLFANVGSLSDGGVSGALAGGAMFLLVGAVIVLAVPYLFVNLLLGDFVVPLMYHRHLTATQAWGAFLPLLRRNPLDFVLYGLFIVLLHVALGALMVVLTPLTCCVGPLVLSLPYIGTVLLLPVWVTYRAYSLEFLAQFGLEYTVFPGPPEGGEPDPRGPGPGL